MAPTNNLAHLVLGAPLLISSPHTVFYAADNFPVIPESLSRKRSCRKVHSKNPSMLMPKDAEFFSVVIDKVGGVYIRPRGEEEIMYMIKPEFALLSRIVPADSSCLVIVYHCDSGILRMGLYDLLRLSGVDFNTRTLLERHSILHSTFNFNLAKLKEYTATDSAFANFLETSMKISVHWVGWQEACMRVILEDSMLPFHAACICRLEETGYVHMILPIKT